MKKRFRDTELWKWLRTLLQIIGIALIFLACTLIFDWLMSTGHAETTEAYVLCDSYVNVRQSPSRQSDVIGRFECGEQLTLDGKSKNGFLHCVDLSLEVSDGWIHSGYVVYDEPIKTNEPATIVSKGRLAARNMVKGDRLRWLKPLATVRVYYWSDEWCVTNCGYVQTKYLEPEGE